MHKNTEPEFRSAEDDTFDALRRMPWSQVSDIYKDIVMDVLVRCPLESFVEECDRRLAHTGWTVKDIEERSRKSFKLKVS